MFHRRAFACNNSTPGLSRANGPRKGPALVVNEDVGIFIVDEGERVWRFRSVAKRADRNGLRWIGRFNVAQTEELWRLVISLRDGKEIVAHVRERSGDCIGNASVHFGHDACNIVNDHRRNVLMGFLCNEARFGEGAETVEVDDHLRQAPTLRRVFRVDLDRVSNVQNCKAGMIFRDAGAHRGRRTRHDGNALHAWGRVATFCDDDFAVSILRHSGKDELGCVDPVHAGVGYCGATKTGVMYAARFCGLGEGAGEKVSGGKGEGNFRVVDGNGGRIAHEADGRRLIHPKVDAGDFGSLLVSCKISNVQFVRAAGGSANKGGQGFSEGKGFNVMGRVLSGRWIQFCRNSLRHQCKEEEFYAAILQRQADPFMLAASR